MPDPSDVRSIFPYIACLCPFHLMEAVSFMTFFKTMTRRKLLIIIHDLVVSVTAILASFYIRFEHNGLVRRLDELAYLLPVFTVYACLVYAYFNLYRAKWRFASLPDLKNITQAVTVLALSLTVFDYFLASSSFYGQLLFGKVTIALYWVLQICFLGGPRLAYRYYRLTRTRAQGIANEASPVLIVGRASDADVVLRAIEGGAIKKIQAVGILSPAVSDRGQSIRGIAVLGALNELERAMIELEQNGVRATRLILTPSVLGEDDGIDRLLTQARKMGLPVNRLPSLEAGRSHDGQSVRLAPVDVEDLMLRERVDIDYDRLKQFVRGKRVAVTGGGGSIGAELCMRLASYGVEKLLILENAEPALHTIQERLAAATPDLSVEGQIADIRDRARVFSLFHSFEPHIVFHAAALKHVPILERNWQEGVKTNVFGSVNVCDAAIASGADALVMISTDKAIEPVSILGATKRLAEMYAQSLDSELIPGRKGQRKTRLISVRFGNVLASSGSVIPKFKAQIEAGGPVTVTHPDMVRYFMTIREACDLVVTAAHHAEQPIVPAVSVYVLNMGQPVRILDVAEQMIRLSGFEPGRDIDIVFSGIRPGERLNEILFASDEPTRELSIPGIVGARTNAPTAATMRTFLAELEACIKADDRDQARALFSKLIPSYKKAA